MALIRPRGGNFVYNNHEMDVMIADIDALPLGLDGVVIGALTQEGDVDVARTSKLASAAAAKRSRCNVSPRDRRRKRYHRCSRKRGSNFRNN